MLPKTEIAADLRTELRGPLAAPTRFTTGGAGEWWLRALAPVAFASVLPALFAFWMCAAVSGALGLAMKPATALLAGSGCLFVYGIDRLRDLERDRFSSPRRSAFVARHRLALGASCAGAGVASLLAAASLPLGAWVLCSGVLGLGLLHRRFKTARIAKPLYITGAWVAITVGLPAVTAEVPPSLARLAACTGIAGCAIGANLVASNLRPGAGSAGLRAAFALAIGGCALALAAPVAVGSLLWVPLAQLIALIGYQPGELYRGVTLDASLALGALASLLHALSIG